MRPLLDHPPVVVRQSRVKLRLGFIGAAVVAATAANILLQGRTTSVFGMSLLLILFAAMAAGALVCFVAPGEMTIGPDGVDLKLAWGRWRYAWRDLDSFEVRTLRWIPRLVVNYAPDCPRVLKGPTSGNCGQFNPFWTMGLSEMAEVLTEAKRKWGESDGLR